VESKVFEIETDALVRIWQPFGVFVFPNPSTFGQILGTDYAHSTHTLWPFTPLYHKSKNKMYRLLCSVVQ